MLLSSPRHVTDELLVHSTGRVPVLPALSKALHMRQTLPLARLRPSEATGETDVMLEIVRNAATRCRSPRGRTDQRLTRRPRHVP